MDHDNLIRMANRIGDFFQAMPDHQEAKDGITLHIRKFWEPRMRRQLYEVVDRQSGAGLSALVLEAVKDQRAQLLPQ